MKLSSDEWLLGGYRRGRIRCGERLLGVLDLWIAHFPVKRKAAGG